jgi:hypothetical protein
VAIWGLGFTGAKRRYGLAECERLIDFFQQDGKYGGNTVMLGIPSFWRTQERDATPDPALHRALAKADVLSPWTVGRYRTPAQARRHATAVIQPDLAWTKARDIDYLPVVFPGFSWQNLQRARGREVPHDDIPRRGGRFLWSQAAAFHQAGARMLYVAMFDELDEGTAIFKCRGDPPVGDSRFLRDRELPSDHYLWLTGEIGKLVRGARQPTDTLPSRQR